MLKIYNSLTRKIEDFKPINPPNVGMYTCGQTVYDFAHIGHGRKYVNDDLLRRILTLFGYKVTHVQNVTDVGHLVSDADSGEDKLEKGAKKTGKTVWEVAEFFTRHFYDSMDKLNILRPMIICRATNHIPEQIELIKKIIARGYGYETPEAVYFATAKFKKYSNLFGQKLADKKVAVREEVKTGEHKRNPADFVLWFKRVGRFENHAMHWPSPWGEGFPGWHIECSAMSLKYLGNAFENGSFHGERSRTIDIHTGGQDHLSVHHPNEIAQSEAATGKPFAKYWIHHAFLLVDAKKMSKSLGNYYRIEDIEKKGFNVMALRYLYLTVHYRQEMNFTFESLKAASEAYEKLKLQMIGLKNYKERDQLSGEKLKKIDDYRNRFTTALENDLNLPQALGIAWEVIKSNIPASDKYDLLASFNEVFGLTFEEEKVIIPEKVKELAQRRFLLRKQQQFEEADSLRKEIEQLGFLVEDKDGGFSLKSLK